MFFFVSVRHDAQCASFFCGEINACETPDSSPEVASRWQPHSCPLRDSVALNCASRLMPMSALHLGITHYLPSQPLIYSCPLYMYMYRHMYIHYVSCTASAHWNVKRTLRTPLRSSNYKLLMYFWSLQQLLMIFLGCSCDCFCCAWVATHLRGMREFGRCQVRASYMCWGLIAAFVACQFLFPAIREHPFSVH